MTKIIRTLDEIDPGYNAVFCDLWGCLHDGTRAFPQRSRRSSGFARGAEPSCC